MNGEKNVEQTRQENCRVEYGVVAEGWKFFATLRFIVAAFTVTLQSALVTLYTQVMKDGAGKEQMGAVIAFAGVYTIVAVLLIELRTILFLVETMRRGSELEFSLGVTEGFFHRLLAPGLFYPRGFERAATHTGGLAIVYLSIFVLWNYLFALNLHLFK